MNSSVNDSISNSIMSDDMSDCDSSQDSHGFEDDLLMTHSGDDVTAQLAASGKCVEFSYFLPVDGSSIE